LETSSIKTKIVHEFPPTFDNVIIEKNVQKENGSPTIVPVNARADISSPPEVCNKQAGLRGEIQERKLLVRMQNGEVKEINARVLIVPKNSVKTVNAPKGPVIQKTVPITVAPSSSAQGLIKVVPIEKLTKPIPLKNTIPQGPSKNTCEIKNLVQPTNPSRIVQISRQLVTNEPLSVVVKGTTPKINVLPQSSKQASLVRTVQPQSNIELSTVQNRTQVLNVISKSATNSITVQGDRKNVILNPSPSVLNSKVVIIQKKIVPGVSLLKKPEIKQDIANKPETKLINRPLDR
jgi:hypothetical protein